jgi:hypothetical protein
MGNWLDRHPGRYDRWNNWGNNVRFNYNNYDIYHNCFNSDWWGHHYHDIGGWHYGHCFNNHPPSYWWTVPTFAGLTNWFTWSAPASSWQEPIYYDYGQGGNVYYENNMVYVDGQEVGTPQDFAASAAALATVEPPTTEEQADNADWMPLGTFAVSSNQKDANPTRVVQFAVNKSGIVSGTLYNETTDEAQTVLGQVDKETQRVALRVGESEDIVVETGLYNLTQNEAPVMIHFGPDRVESWLLVRLEQPKDQGGTP